jgi:hypothetical protein
MLKKCLAVLFLVGVFSFPTSAEQTITCSSGYVDMLDWLTLDSDLRSNHYLTGSHPLGTAVWSDKFWWLKDLSAISSRTTTSWDINLYDSNYIYWWLTQDDDPYNSARDFKKATYDWNFVAAPRCAPQGYPGIQITINDSSYDEYRDCSYSQTRNLNKGWFALWGPYYESLGGDMPDNMPIMRLAYYWGCNNSYQYCNKEVYHLSQRYGLVQWDLITPDANGQETLTATSVFNTLASGQVPYDWYCF